MKYIFLYIKCLFCLLLNAQQTEYVDFKTAKAFIALNPSNKEVSGALNYHFDILQETDSIFIDAQHMEFHSVLLNKAESKYYNDEKKLWIISDFKPSKNNKVSFSYKVKPKKAIYFVKRDNENQIWTQGQGKYTSNWLPSFDDVNEKVEFDLSITFVNDYEVIVNGKLINKEENEKTTKWHYDMKEAMSSYLIALAIGKYNKKVKPSKSAIPLEMYYYPEDSAKVEPTYRYTKQMFDFLEDEIGFPFPWQNYKQVPVHDFLYSGMENTSLTIFSDAFMIDDTAFVDKNYVNVNAHELAHQWFGDLVTAKSGDHHWLQEGFATYYALLAERDVFGDNYYYWRLYEYMEALQNQDLAGQSTSLLNPKSSSLTFYKKGALLLHVLKEKVGEAAFKIAVKRYLEKHQYKNVETINFITEVEKTSQQDLSAFVDLWLNAIKFPYNDVLESLKQSVFIQEYLMVDAEVANSKTDYFLASGISDEAKIKIISQAPNRITSDVFKSSIKVRQAIALNLSKIPSALKADYETLLTDKSYITIEAALYNLWVNFPDDRLEYLKNTKGIQGFSDKNVRILWLTLVMLTPDFEPNNKDLYKNELVNYTTAKYHFEVRRNAFQYLKMIDMCHEKCKESLKDASKHHNWRFKKYAKRLIEENQ